LLLSRLRAYWPCARTPEATFFTRRDLELRQDGDVRRTALLIVLLLAEAGTAAAPGEAPAKPAAARPWIDPTGDAIVGFGLLRVVPPLGGGSFRVHYKEKPTEYTASDQFQLFVLPGDAFARKENAYASEFLAFTRTDPAAADGYADLTVTFHVDAETTVIVGYGPWTAPDSGRPPGDVPTFSLTVTPVEPAGAFEWCESEMGELITTNWTNRPGVKRGAPVHDAVADADLFVEVRPMILYDGRMVRTAEDELALRLHFDQYAGGGGHRDEPNLADQRLAAERTDHRITMTDSLAEKFRRVPIRWR
jgi:hypothetical protein